MLNRDSEALNYHFIEYRANEMIPGDWEWYLNTYSSDPATGMRLWLKNGALTVHAYELPSDLRHHVITAISFSPMAAKQYSNKTLPAPSGVRRGIVTCVRKDFADLLGSTLTENAIVGELRTHEGKQIVRDWLPILIKKSISIPIGKPNDPIATAKHMPSRAIYDSDNYILILPDDIYQVARGFRFKGCKISRCAVSD